MMSMANHVAISVETIRIDSGCNLDNEFIELICMHIFMILYLRVNQVYSCRLCMWSFHLRH